MASYVFSLAKEFGWSEEYILTELPYSRGCQYKHAIARSYDVPTYYQSTKEEKDELKNMFLQLTQPQG